MTERIPVVVLVGPTAVGKTETAIRLAERLEGEIVSADSRLLYRGMDIGTAKPTPDQRARVPHHLIDVADPKEPWSLALYQQAALQALRAIHARGRLPFLVGGTGQYVRAVVEGWSPPPRPPDDRLRRELEAFAAEHGPEALHRRLAQVDPARAAEIDPRNVRRVVRALEIYELTGVPPSRLRRKEPPPLDPLWVGLTLPRPELYTRIDERIDRMLASGWLEEVRRLLSSGLSPDSPAMSAIGYRQLARHLQGELSLEEAVREIRRVTRQFVRRQANWFKPDDPRIHWFEARPGVEEQIEPLIRRWLADRQSASG